MVLPQVGAFHSISAAGHSVTGLGRGREGEGAAPWLSLDLHSWKHTWVGNIFHLHYSPGHTGGRALKPEGVTPNQHRPATSHRHDSATLSKIKSRQWRIQSPLPSFTEVMSHYSSVWTPSSWQAMNSGCPWSWVRALHRLPPSLFSLSDQVSPLFISHHYTRTSQAHKFSLSFLYYNVS